MVRNWAFRTPLPDLETTLAVQTSSFTFSKGKLPLYYRTNVEFEFKANQGPLASFRLLTVYFTLKSGSNATEKESTSKLQVHMFQQPRKHERVKVCRLRFAPVFHFPIEMQY